MRNRRLALSVSGLLAAAAPVAAQTTVSQTTPASPVAAIASTKAREGVLRLLDRQSNAVTTQQLVLEQAITPWPEISIRIKSCTKDYHGMRGLDVAWVSITAPVGQEGYEGWVFNWYPAAAMWQHPRYTVQLMRCGPLSEQRRLTPSQAGGVVVTGADNAPLDEVPVNPQGATPENTGDVSATQAPANAVPTEEPTPGAPVEEEQPAVTEPVPTEAPAEVSPAPQAGASDGSDPFFVPGIDTRDSQQVDNIINQTQ